MKVSEVYRPKEVLCPKYYEVKKEITGKLKDVVSKQRLYWSDDRLKHWFFDFKFEGSWISCYNINNELNEIQIIIYEV